MQHFRTTLRFFGLIVTCFRTALAAKTLTVTVGKEGSFYNPVPIFAELNDMVVFEFEGLAHSVIQGSFDNPCFPLEGGFSSGVVQGPNTTVLEPRTWNLTISNDTSAIWFYCGLTVPTSHCASGMVGAINPPSLDAFNQYSAAAKRVTAAVPTSIATVLTGQAAFATAPPGFPTPPVPVTTTTPTSMPTISTSSSMIPPPTSAPTPTEEPTKNSKTGGIIGGSVAGGVVALAILMSLLCVLRRRGNRFSRGSKDFFRYQARTRAFGSGAEGSKPSPFIGSPTESNNAHKDLPSPMTQSTPTPASSVFSPPPDSTHPYSTATPRVSNFNSTASSSSSSPSSPPTRTTSIRRPPLPPVPAPPVPTPPVPAPPARTVPNPSPRAAERKLPHPPVRSSTLEDGGDIRALAREVAAVLSQGQFNGDRDASYGNSVNRRESIPPPGYRSAIGV